MSRLSVWEKGEKIGRIVGAEREVPSYPFDRRPVHPTDPNDLHPYPSLNKIILLKLQSHPNSACEQGTYAASSGEILKFFNSPPKLSPNWHKLACVTESLNPCSLHRHFIETNAAFCAKRETRGWSRFVQNTAFVALGSSMLLFILMRLIFISSSLFGSRVTSPAAMLAILTSEPARTPLTSQGGVQKNNVYI